MLLTHLFKAGIDATAVVVVTGTRPWLLMTVPHVAEVVALDLVTPFATID